MSGLDVIDSVCGKIQGVFQDYKLLNKSGVLQAVKVFLQYTPLPAGITFNAPNTGYDDDDYDTNFPCIIVKSDGITDKEERQINQNRTAIRLLFGVYDDKPECTGWRDIMAMIDRARYYLLTERVIARKYHVGMPIESTLLEADTYPLYFGEMKFWLEGGRPIMKHDFVYERYLQHGQ